MILIIPTANQTRAEVVTRALYITTQGTFSCFFVSFGLQMSLSAQSLLRYFGNLGDHGERNACDQDLMNIKNMEEMFVLELHHGIKNTEGKNWNGGVCFRSEVET